MRHLAALLIVLGTLAATAPAFAQSSPTVPIGIAGEALSRGGDAADAGDFERAVLDFSLFILLNPTDARGYYMRGLSYYYMDDVDSAVTDMTSALRYSEALPELHASVLATRSEFYAMRGENAAAVGDLDALIAIRPSSEAYFQRGILRLATAAFEQAVADIDEAIDRATDADPLLYLYRAYAQDGLQNTAAAASDYLEWVNRIGGQTSDEEPLESGGALTLQMAQSLVYHIPFSAKRGAEINVLARNVGGDINPLVVILAPDGTPLVANDDARAGRDTNALVSGYEAPESGDYHLLVTHSFAGYDGSVQVLLETR